MREAARGRAGEAEKADAAATQAARMVACSEIQNLLDTPLFHLFLPTFVALFKFYRTTVLTDRTPLSNHFRARSMLNFELKIRLFKATESSRFAVFMTHPHHFLGTDEFPTTIVNFFLLRVSGGGKAARRRARRINFSVQQPAGCEEF